MARWLCRLGPRSLSADCLVALAKQRRSGCCRLRSRQREVALWLHQGRPWQMQWQGQASFQDMEQLKQTLGQVALWHVGEGSFEEDGDGQQSRSGSTMDPLLCILQSLLQQLESVQVEAAVAARAQLQITASPLYSRLMQACLAYGIQEVPAPSRAMSLGQWIQQIGARHERIALAHLIVGGVQSLQEHSPWQEERLPAAEMKMGQVAPSPGLTPLQEELERLCGQQATLSAYQWLGLERDCSTDQVRSAYFAKAKIWHQDKLLSEGWSTEQLAKAQGIFEHIEQSYQTLVDDKERKTYDWVLERKAKGLPIDPEVILKAEELFHKAARLVRNGQSVAALPLLREVVALNKGEASYWAYLGFAIYGQQGHQGLSEAWSCLDKAALLQEQSVIDEFRGKIVAAENRLDEAVGWLEKALAQDQNNKEAEQHLRWVREKMQRQHLSAEPGGLLGRWWGKSTTKHSQ